MFGNIVKKFVGSRNDRTIKQLSREIDAINQLEDSHAGLSDDALRENTVKLRERFEAGETLDDLLPEAFANVREAGKRVLNMRHFDVQLIGGMVLNSGRIAEMRTGEGKTLVATTAVYLNALTGRGVHVLSLIHI